MNLEKRRVISSLNLSDQHKESSSSGGVEWAMNNSRKLDVLRTFYRNVVGPIFIDSFIPSPHAMNENGGKQNIYNLTGQLPCNLKIMI